MIQLPKQYEFLLNEGAPRMLVKALEDYGLAEIPGSRNNEVIMGWAREAHLGNVYVNDDTAWCGLAAYIWAKRADKIVPFTPIEALWALNWRKFGTKVSIAMLGDVLVFSRQSGGHVGIYVGEDRDCYHVLGGNTSNKVSITRILKARVVGIRRPIYLTAQPANVRKIMLGANGPISQNEA